MNRMLFTFIIPPSQFPIPPFSNARKRSSPDNFELPFTMHSFHIFSDRHGLNLAVDVDSLKSQIKKGEILCQEFTTFLYQGTFPWKSSYDV